MQTDNSDYQRHQLVEALGQCGQQLRNTAGMLDNYAAFLQNISQSSFSLPAQNVFQMFTPPQSGGPAVGVPGSTTLNGAAAAARAPTRGRKRRVADPTGEPEVDENGKKRRKRVEKKPRDPNAPKRPPSAYLIFQNEVREEMKKRYSDKPYIEVLNKISERWSMMDDSQKKSYTDQTNNLRAKFEVNKAAYDASLVIQNGAAPAASSVTSPTAPTAAPVAAPPALPTPPVPTVQPTVVPAVPTAAPEQSDEESEDEEASEGSETSEASSGAVVSAAVAQSPKNSSESESSEESLSDGGEEVSPPKPASKKAEKPASKKRAAPTPARLAANTKAGKENKKKDKK